MQSPKVNDKMIQQALYHLAMFISCMTKAVAETDVEVKTTPAAFRLKDAATYIGTRPGRLKRMRAEGQIRTVVIGGNPKYLKKDLDRILQQAEREADKPVMRKVG